MSPAEYRPLLEAVSFASRAHAAQKRKDGITPYASHPFRVCLIVRDCFGFDDPRMLIAAVLHDTIEDTNTDFDDLEEKYGREIAHWVALLSKDKRLPDETREKAYIEGLQNAPWQVQACKLADLFDNLTDLVNLPAERRRRSLERWEVYFRALQASDCEETRTARQKVAQLIEETRRGIDKAGKK